MARKVITTYIDDIDGSEAEGPVAFSYNGRSYEIDLSTDNKQKLEEALAPFISAARTTAGTRRVSSGAAAASRQDLAAIREWAKANNIQVSDRGRIAASVIEAYDAANK